MFADILRKVRKIFGAEIDSADFYLSGAGGHIGSPLHNYNYDYAVKYEDAAEFNIASILANKLANIVCSEVSAEIDGVGGAKKEFLESCLQKVVSRLHLITARAFGTGGVILKPYIFGGKIYTDIIPQSRFIVLEQKGEIITKAVFWADMYCETDKDKEKNRDKNNNAYRIDT